MTVFKRSGGVVSKVNLRRHGGTGVVRPHIRTPGPPPVVPTGDTLAYSSEPLGAGGWVTGLSISPDGNTRLARTDTLGAWRWDTAADKWKPSVTADSMPDNYSKLDTGQGVQAIVAGNSAAFMGYRTSIYKSVDRGVTWTVSLAAGPATAPNVSGRWWNDRMAFDPNNAAVCIYGTYSAGLYYTLDTGATWTQVPSGSLPFGNSGFGIPCVTIDGSGNWYAAPYGAGIYKSADHGATWTKISSDAQFVAAFSMRAGDNGDIMACVGTDTSLTAATARVYRYRSGAWANVSPAGTQKWRSFAYDPLHAGKVMLQAEGGYVRFSADYGSTWVAANRQFTSSTADVPWLANANGTNNQGFFVTVGGLQFDPVVSNRVWHSQGIGVWKADLTSTLTDQVTWQANSRGIEQLVTNDVIAPPGGPAVVVSWDRPVFVTGETGGTGVYPYRYHPTDGKFDAAWAIDYSASTPAFLVTTTGSAAATPAWGIRQSGYSQDGGLTWTAFPTVPLNSTQGITQFGLGSIHVGTPNSIIWVSALSHGTYRSTDKGVTWTAVSIPGVTMGSLNSQSYSIYRRPIAFEKTSASADTCYAMVPNVGVFRSTDGGANWTQRCDNTPFTNVGTAQQYANYGQNAYLKTVPGNPGHLFLTPGFQGGPLSPVTNLPFMRSTDGGTTWSMLPNLKSVRGFDFGKAATGQTYPAVYALGVYSGVTGLYRSIDNCTTWELLTAQPNRSVDFLRTVAASKDTYGLHWITTTGSGMIRGELV